MNSVFFFLGSLISFIYCVLLLRNKETRLLFFITGFILNIGTNLFAKQLVQDPKPTNDYQHIVTAIVNQIHVDMDKLGMPSIYTQIISFCLFFLLYWNDSVYSFYSILMFNGLLVVASIHYYNNHEHSLMQLCVGILFGAMIGYLFGYLSNRYIAGNIEIKKDDQCYLV